MSPRTLWMISGLIMLLALEANPALAVDPKAMASQASAALLKARQLESLTGAEMTQLLTDERFKEFEERSHKYERLFASDPLWESSLTKLYGAIDGTNPLLKEKLDKWVRLNPSYVSYTARGTYEVNLAYHERGQRYAQDTPPENMARMEASLSQAASDLRKSLQLNPQFIPAYIELLELAQAEGDVDAAQAIEERATHEVPSTYYLRYSYLENLRPRWGGSYELMTAYEDALTDAARLNPRIWSLKGASWGERGYDAWQQEDWPRAIAYYSKALEFGDRMEFFRARGIAYYNSHDYASALRDFTRYRDYGGTDDVVVNQCIQCSEAVLAHTTCPVDPAATNEAAINR